MNFAAASWYEGALLALNRYLFGSATVLETPSPFRSSGLDWLALGW